MVVLPIAAMWPVARVLEGLGGSEHFYTHLAPVAGLALSVSVLWATFERLHLAPRDPRSAIAEAFISSLLIAIAFSQLDWVLNQALENPLNQIIPPSQSGTYLYFSLITLSRVGYGGIVPVNPYLRSICALESMAGIFYVAVVVARLVSSYRPEVSSEQANNARKSHFTIELTPLGRDFSQLARFQLPSQTNGPSIANAGEHLA